LSAGGARAQGLRLELTKHLGAGFNWFAVNEVSGTSGPYAGIPYDGNDPAFEDLYFANHRGYPLRKSVLRLSYTDNDWFQRHWFARIKDVIDRYQPDVLCSDGGVPFGEIDLHIVAHLYNTSARLHSSVNRASTIRRTPTPTYTRSTFSTSSVRRQTPSLRIPGRLIRASATGSTTFAMSTRRSDTC